MNMLTYAAAFLTGLLASLGVGGGMVLIIWFTAVLGMSQLDAQGINLLFFLPIALLSVIMHRKNGLVRPKELMPAFLTGTVGAVGGFFAARFIGSQLLGKIFAVFIIIIGIKELISSFTDNNRK